MRCPRLFLAAPRPARPSPPAPRAPADVPEEAPPATPVRLEKVARGTVPARARRCSGWCARPGGRGGGPGGRPAALPRPLRRRAAYRRRGARGRGARPDLPPRRRGRAWPRRGCALELTASELARHQRAFDAGVEAAAVLASYKAEAELAPQPPGRRPGPRSRRLALRAPVSGRLIVDHRIPPESEVTAGHGPRPHRRRRARSRSRAGPPPRTATACIPGLKVRFVAPGARAALGRGGDPRGRADGRGRRDRAADRARSRDPEGLPAPGEGVELRVELDARPQALTVPEEALVVSESGERRLRRRARPRGLMARRRPSRPARAAAGGSRSLRGLVAGRPGGGRAAPPCSTDGDPIAEVEGASRRGRAAR